MRKNPAGTCYWRQNLIQVQPKVLCAPLDCALGKAFSEVIHKLRLSKHECQIQASPFASHKKAEMKLRRKLFFLPWWVDLGQLPNAHLATLTTLFNKKGGKNKMKKPCRLR